MSFLIDGALILVSGIGIYYIIRICIDAARKTLEFKESNLTEP
jgi:hypothetical protein